MRSLLESVAPSAGLICFKPCSIPDFGSVYSIHQSSNSAPAVERTWTLSSKDKQKEAFMKYLYLALLLLLPLQALAQTGACDKLSVLDCFERKGCFLGCEGKDRQHCAPYVCRAAKGRCETPYAQDELSKEKCEAISGCQYDAAVCFCPGPMACFCGGGAPAMCRERS